MSDTGEKQTSAAYDSFENKPEYGKWEGSWYPFTWRTFPNEEPNWLRRVMTSWMFGVKWKKRDK